MRLYELLGKLVNHETLIPRVIRYKGDNYEIKPGENFTYYKQGSSHCDTLHIDTYDLRGYVEIVEGVKTDKYENLKQEFRKLQDKLTEYEEQLDNLEEEIDNLD